MATHESATLPTLRLLSRLYPTVQAATSEVVKLSGELTHSAPTIHVISDIHGEYSKLRHVINNGSGALRRLVNRLFEATRPEVEREELLRLLMYPREMGELVRARDGAEGFEAFARRMLRDVFHIIRNLAGKHDPSHVDATFPAEFREVFRSILEARTDAQTPHCEAMIEVLSKHQSLELVLRLSARVVRNLMIDELVIAGDLWDRGPRGDRVLDYIEHQPNVAITWGNHDVAWLGACLGHEALIAQVVRMSLRYRRLSQLEEGYGITMQPLEYLARHVYADDPAECFVPKGSGLREPLQMARMQKAAAIMQLKLEGQLIQRRPEFDLKNRLLLDRIRKNGTVQIDGREYRLRDTYFPTIDSGDPYKLSPEESSCLERMRESFLASQKLWVDCRYLVQRGSMYVRRADHLIFHGCLAVDEQGRFLPMPVAGRDLAGREQFEALDALIVGSLYRPSLESLDTLWYLWCGPRSPLFGKDKIAMFENYFVDDHAVQQETKNPYFQLVHQPEFCARVLEEFGVPRTGMIINGHVPVKIEKGESPIKASKMAITIDGAFSEAYGDHGYTYVIERDRTFIAQHTHFESVAAAIRDGIDIIPTILPVRKFDPPHEVSDTEQGDEIRAEITLLEELIAAYRTNRVRQREVLLS